MSQEKSTHSERKTDSPLKRSILYEHLLKNIALTSKNSLPPPSLDDSSTRLNRSTNTRPSENGPSVCSEIDHDNLLTDQHHSTELRDIPAPQSEGKQLPSSNVTNDRDAILCGDTIAKRMNLSKKATLSSEEDFSVPLNLCVKKASTPISASCAPVKESSSREVPSKLLVNNLAANNHHQLFANALLNQAASTSTSFNSQQKKRGRKPKALLNNDSNQLLNQFTNLTSAANNYRLPSTLGPSTHTSTLNNVNSDQKPRKRGRPPTLSPPSHNSIPLLAAHASNLGKANSSGAFASSYPFNLFNTPDVLSSWPGLNALTAAAAAAAAAAAGNSYPNNQNPFSIFNKLNSKDVNQFNLNLLNTNLFTNLKNHNQSKDNNDLISNNNKERRSKEDQTLSTSKNVADNNSHKSFAHKPNPNEKQLRIPLNHGWKRLTYISGFSKLGALEGDVNYIAPCGKKIKSYPELIKYLTKNSITSMTRDNFSFDTNVIVGQFIENLQEYGSEVLLSESQVKVQLEEINKIRNFSSNHLQSNSSIYSDKKRRVRDSGGTRNVYDNLKNFKSSHGNKNLFEDNSYKNDFEPSITITVQNPSRGSKRKLLDQSRVDFARNEKLLKKQEEERHLKELKEKQEEERKLKEAQERQLELQKQEEQKLQADIERERHNQHQMFIQALNELQTFAEKEAKKQEVALEKTAYQERKIVKRHLELELMKELKKPIEDMLIKDLKDLPTFNRIPGLKLTGKAFADSLMVYEFLYNFGETIGFDTESLPNLNTLMMALLNMDKEAEEELMSIVIHLVVCAIEDPGLPTNVTTALGQKLKDATVTVHNLTEILRLYFLSFYNIIREEDREKRTECQIYDALSSGIPFLAMNATNKLNILVFLCNELLCNQAIVKQIDDNIESVASFKKDKWLIENDIRKLRLVKMKRERITELENAKLKESMENCEESVDSDNEETSATVTTAPPSIAPESEDDVSMTNEEIDKKVEKLNKQCNNMNNKLNRALNSYRVFPLGQDRYRRTYWLLPNCGGVFVEAMESGEPMELDNNIIDDELESVKSEEEDSNETNEIGIKSEVGTDADEKSSVLKTEPEISQEEANLSQNEDDCKESFQIDSKLEDENQPKEDIVDTKEIESSTDSNQKEEITTEEEEDEDDDIKGMKWFDLIPTNCGAKVDETIEKHEEEDEEDEEEVADEELMEYSLDDKDSPLYRQLEEGFKTFIDEDTMKCLFAFVDKNMDAAILKDNCIRILSNYPKSISFTKFKHCDFTEGDTAVCLNLQKRIQAWRALQHDLPLKIDREFQLGWWRITDPAQLKSLLEILHSNALRERNLLKHIDKYMIYATQSCKFAAANLEVNDFDREMSEFREHGAPTENKCPHKSCHSRGYCQEVSLSKDLQVLELVEAFEEKIVSSSMQVRNWKASNRSCTEFRLKISSMLIENSWSKQSKSKSSKKKQKSLDSLKDSSENETTENGTLNENTNSNTSFSNGIAEDGSDDDILQFQREKLLEVESGIERRYLKPPLGFKNNNQLVNSAPSDLSNGDDCGDYAIDENVTTGLLRWRDAVRDASCCSQIAMCLHFLENCIAWDKSIMRASCQFCGSGENEAQLLLCDLCDKGYHMYCFKPKMDNVPSGDWFCFDCQNKNTIDRVCIVCGKKGKLLNCDTCAKAFHPNCLDPPMTKQLKGRWICHLCLRKNKRYSNSSSKASKKSTTASTDDKNTESPNATLNTLKESKRVSNGNSKEKADKKEKKSKSKEEKDKVEKIKKASSPIVTNEENCELDLCRILFEELKKHESCWPFLEPVNTKQFPTYKKIIKKPMDFTTIQYRFDSNVYKTKEDFSADIRLIFDNCVLFNEDESPVGEAGHSLRAFFESRWQEFSSTT